MDLLKDANICAGMAVDQGELERINRFSRKKLEAEEVYVFSVRLCDNEIDRDGERFSNAALDELAGRFVGKSGVFDHQWSARGQAARIYRTQVEEEPGTRTGAGDGYRYLKAWAYMLRTEGNRDLIAEIEGGIKKEVSVGCAVERKVCSVCGEDLGKCRHVAGRTYNGKRCWGELTGVTDAYEWSFVAVPAQPRAGVMKGYVEKGDGGVDLRKALEGAPEGLAELERLEKEAAMGRRYMESLRKDVVRLGALAEPELGAGVLKAIAEKLEDRELLELKAVLERRAKGRFPGGVQLTYAEETGGAERDGAFLI